MGAVIIYEHPYPTLILNSKLENYLQSLSFPRNVIEGTWKQLLISVCSNPQLVALSFLPKAQSCSK